MRYGSRLNFGLSILTALFLLATLLAVLLYAFTSATPALRGPVLLTALVLILVCGLLFVGFLLRWLLRPYRQLVGEAERAAQSPLPHRARDEAAFVLETFQSVVAQLQSQQKELERLGTAARERADSAERFSERILASIPSGLIAFDGAGLAKAVNTPASEILGIGSDALGQPVRTLLNKIPELADLVDRCLATGNVFPREELEVLSEDGSNRRLGTTVAPVELAGQPGKRGALCLVTDISEVTQLREQLALKNNLESLGEMSAGLAHELKNAFATLHGYAQLLESLPLDERGQTAVTSMLGEVRNLSEMVNAFLNFARPQPLQLDRVILGELVNECVVELGPLFDECRVNLDLDESVSPSTLTVSGDERLLRQAILNLLRNAAEAIPDDNAQRRVEVRLSRITDALHREFACLTVRDTGTGIPPRDLQRIFLPFFTTKARGHGVGLALAHRVILEHGGTLTARNGPDGGALLTVKLPLLAAADSNNGDLRRHPESHG
jgi:PAS domain S-box-containing protein